MMEAELDAVICSGPRRGKQFTYALLDARVATVAAIDRDDALTRLTRLYFGGRSPATVHDYGWWSGLSMADGRRGIDMAGRALTRRVIDGREYWHAAGIDVPRSASTHLLPNYDEFFISHTDRRAIGDRLRSVQAVTGGNALIAHVVVVDGQLVGGWRLQHDPVRTVARFQLLDRLVPAERKRVSAALRRLTAFLGREVVAEGMD